MTEQEFEVMFDRYELDNEYAEYIMERCSVGNGEALIRLMERGDYYEDFKDHIMATREAI